MGYGGEFRSNSGGFRGGSRGGGRGFSGGGGFRRNFGPREMTKIKCAECGKEDEVPFKPREGTAVLCKECFFKKKGITPRSQSEGPKEKEAKMSSDFDESEESDEAFEDSEEFEEDIK